MVAKAVVMGRDIQAPGYKTANFFSTTSFLDFDLVVLDLGNIFREYCEKADKWHSENILSNAAGRRLFSALSRRAEEFIDYLKHDRPAVIIATPIGRFQWIDEDGHYYEGVDASDYFGACGPKTVAQSGSAIEYVGPRWAHPFGKLLLPHLRYLAVLSETEARNPMFVIKGTKKPVGSLLERGKTWVLTVPTFSNTSEDADKDFAKAIDLFATAHRQRIEPAQLPNWHLQFHLPGELALRQTAIELQDELDQHKKKVDENLTKIAELEQLKGLTTEQGQKLVDLVKLAMERLGFQVKSGPEGQDDLIAQYGERFAVLEIKGRDQSSAAEKDAAQLEKWSSRFYEEHAKEPKAILVVNAYREKPLDERTAEVFPNQMHKYSVRKEQCLISGLQLLCLLVSISSDLDRQAAVESLLNTTGVYPRFQGTNWAQVISHVPSKRKKA